MLDVDAGILALIPNFPWPSRRPVPGPATIIRMSLATFMAEGKS